MIYKPRVELRLDNLKREDRPTEWDLTACKCNTTTVLRKCGGEGGIGELGARVNQEKLQRISCHPDCS